MTASLRPAVEVTGALVVVVLSREVSAVVSVPAPRVDVVESAARAPTSVAVTSVDRACTPSATTSPKVGTDHDDRCDAAGPGGRMAAATPGRGLVGLGGGGGVGHGSNVRKRSQRTVCGG